MNNGSVKESRKIVNGLTVDQLDARGSNAPEVQSIDDAGSLNMGEAARIRIPLERGLTLETLLVRGAEGAPLIVQFHGALDKAKYEPPRFERLATAKTLGCSVLFVADPTIMLAPNLQLAWYTGWLNFDLHAFIGAQANRLAKLIAASRCVLTGSSGGGFAALQIASFVPGSCAVPMNPQTSIYEYRIDGIHLGPQNLYHQVVMPELKDVGKAPWWAPLATRLSAVEKFRNSQPCSVVFVQNTNDEHHYESHFKPFENVARRTAGDFSVIEYAGPPAHVQPTTEIYLDVLNGVIGSDK